MYNILVHVITIVQNLFVVSFRICSVNNLNGITNIIRFPSAKIHKKLKERWTFVIRNSRKDMSWEPSNRQYICSRHFKDEDIMRTETRPILKATAVPSLHLSEPEIEISEPDIEVLEPEIEVAVKLHQPNLSLTGSFSTSVKNAKITIEAMSDEGVQLLSTFLLSTPLPKDNCGRFIFSANDILMEAFSSLKSIAL